VKGQAVAYAPYRTTFWLLEDMENIYKGDYQWAHSLRKILSMIVTMGGAMMS
jgi:hypothetical protein